MLYLSAQPDDYYFIWQLEIQLRNFREMGICPERIHVLISFNPIAGVSSAFKEFINRHRDFAYFFLYSDERAMSSYMSSVRPHIIKKHFEVYPELYKEIIFYHDSDVLLTRSLCIVDLIYDDVCYVSDTRNYLDTGYILEVSSFSLLLEMANIVGVPFATIKENDQNAGGAQYILKKIPHGFWEKVELDSERLFKTMGNFNSKRWQQDYSATKIRRTDFHGIQSWCADMWAVFWGLLYWGKEVKIHPEMNFSWPYSPIEEWNKFAIHHYSGSQDSRELYFKKTDYVHFSPWYDESLKGVKPDNCSYRLVEIINKRKFERDNLRPHAQNILFIVWDGQPSIKTIDHFQLIKRYILKYFKTNIRYYSGGDEYDGGCFDFSSVNKEIEKIILLPISYIYTKECLVTLIASDINDVSIKIGKAFELDLLFEVSFGKVLNADILGVNRGKFNEVQIDENIDVFSKVNFSICERRLKGFSNVNEVLKFGAVADCSVYKLC